MGYQIAAEIENQPENLISIGDVSRILGVPAHTIRYWEREFDGFLTHARTTGRQRRYGDTDVERLRRVYRMLHEEGYSIAGAKRALSIENRAANIVRSEAATASGEIEEVLAGRIVALVREELERIRGQKFQSAFE